MSQPWRAIAARFDALTARERVVVAVAVLAVVLFVSHAWWLGPQLARRDAALRQIEGGRTELEAVTQQLAALEAQARDPDAALKAKLRGLLNQGGETEARLRDIERLLVAPAEMPKLLQELISRRKGLRLLALRSLPVASLTEPAARPESAPAGASEAAKTDPALGVFRHGVEISLRGRYLDLLAYLADIERLPQRLYWNTATVTADAYPDSILTVAVYTLSLDRTWLAV